jgi:hypothetical protein
MKPSPKDFLRKKSRERDGEPSRARNALTTCGAAPALDALPNRWATRNEGLRESPKAFVAEINTMERICAQPHAREIAATTVRRRLEGADLAAALAAASPVRLA